MRRFSSHLGLISGGLASLCAMVAIGLIAASPVAVTRAPKTTEITAEPPAQIAPHRAIYTMELASVKNRSSVNDVSGHMLFEWRDVCDGWTIQQHMQLHFIRENADDDQNIVSSELTWEAKDGKRYNFNIRRQNNGEETENYRGKAVQNADGTVSVTYTSPDAKTVQLPAGTMFPTAHTALVLQQAARGEKLSTSRVFDGSDEDGSSDISAFISPQRAVAETASVSDKMKSNPLLATTPWPVHLAFFKVGTETGEPDYEMDLHLQPNGIARQLKIDYGDFSVAGNLQEVQPLPAPHCP